MITEQSYLEAKKIVDTYESKQLNKPDVRGQLIAFLRQQTKLHYVTIWENDFEFADKILKAINLP